MTDVSIEVDMDFMSHGRDDNSLIHLMFKQAILRTLSPLRAKNDHVCYQLVSCVVLKGGWAN